MNKTVLLSTIILALSLITASYIHSTHYRYDLVASSDPHNTWVYEIDKKTGTTWHVNSEEKRLVEAKKSPTINTSSNTVSSETTIPNPRIPDDEIAKITGTARLNSSYFEFQFYNGSSWHVTRAIFTITLLKKDGSEIWTRDYVPDRISSHPMETASIRIYMSDVPDNSTVSYKIKEAYGYKVDTSKPF